MISDQDEESVTAEGPGGPAQLSEEELHALYLSYNRVVYQFFANRGFGHEDSRELMQETFLEAHRSSGSFHRKSSPGTWVVGIAKRIWLETVRNGRRKRRTADLVSLSTPSASGQGPDLEARVSETADGQGQLEGLLEGEKVQLLRKAIGELPDRMRYCALLHFVQDRGIPEIAEILQIDRSTVRSQLAQARKRLKESLAEHFTDIL